MQNKKIIYKIRRKIQVFTYNITSPEFVSKLYFRILLKYKLNLKKPKTFNEKLQWLKLYEWPNNELAIKCSDKYRVREYIKEKNMEKYLNDLYGVWDNADDIDFSQLPQQFVLKCNHGCGYNIICDDVNKIDIKVTKKLLNNWLKEKFGKFNAEPHYDKIEPKIICEKFLGGNITDYKFFCFNGKVEFMYIASGFGNGIEEQISFFDKNGNKAPYKRLDYPVKNDAELPNDFNEMKKLSEELSEDFPFVRVDWFEENGRIYFGELTFTPCGGLMKIEPLEYDLKWGELININ